MFDLTEEFLKRLEKAHGVAYLSAISGLVAGPVLALAKMKFDLFAQLDLSKLLLLIFALGAPVLLAVTVGFLLSDAIGAAGKRLDLHKSAPLALASGGFMAHALHAIAMIFSDGTITGYGIWLVGCSIFSMFALVVAGFLERIGKMRQAKASPEWQLQPRADLPSGSS